MKQARILIAIVGLLLFGCKDDTPYAEIGSTNVDIVIMNPTQTTIHGNGEPTHLDGRIDANAKLGGWQAILTNKKTGAIIDTYADLYEHTQYIVHHHWLFTFPDTTEMTITVQALTASSEVIAEKEMDVVYYPQ